ncbi:MAG: minichromosome maintenance protein MCM [Candidatus Geothermarchaeota archaeon]
MTLEVAVKDKISKFFREFRDKDGVQKYIGIINSLPLLEERIVKVDIEELASFDSELVKLLIENPLDFIETAKEAILDILTVEKPLDVANVTKDSIYVAITGETPGYTIRLRDISSKYIGKLVTISGLLVKLSQVYTIPIEIAYEYDGKTIYRRRKSILDRIEAPKLIESGASYRFSKEKSTFIDVQYARVQERPDELPPGQIPRFLDVIFIKPMIDKAFPGDFVKITGILDIRPRERRNRMEYDFVLLANYVESRGREAYEITISKKEEEEFRKLAQRKDFYEKLVKSICPSIYGYDDVKEAILLSLIGGEDKLLKDGTRIRGRIHLLLIGDPGVAKSQLLKYAALIAPKGIYTSGRGVTAAGLTAAVVREPGGGMSLEAGAVVLADMGVCAIDEIDKMRSEDRVALHEAMEQQTVSISKGGIVATLNARTTIISAANPVDGIYNPYKPLLANVDLPVTLLSRYDLIYVIREELSEERDRKLTEHIYLARETEKPYEDTFDPNFMRKFIAYARKLKVKMTEGAFRLLQDYYIRIRKQAGGGDEITSIPITPRQFESLIRLAEASAKAHLRSEVTIEDAKIAIKHMNNFLQNAAIDIDTQQIDVTQIMTGVSAKKASKTATVLDILNELLEANKGNPVSEEEWISAILKKTHIKSREEIIQIIEKLKESGVIYEPMPGYYKIPYKS